MFSHTDTHTPCSCVSVSLWRQIYKFITKPTAMENTCTKLLRIKLSYINREGKEGQSS